MSSEELHELHEHAEHAKHDPSLAPVSVTMATLAVLVAIVSLLGHRAATEVVLNQAKASDQWAYYQAKSIRGHEDKLFANLTVITPASNAEALAKIREEYLQEAERYQEEQGEIQKEAKKMEAEAKQNFHEHEVLARSVTMFQIAIAVAAISALTKRRLYWAVSLLIGAAGCVFLVLGLIVH